MNTSTVSALRADNEQEQREPRLSTRLFNRARARIPAELDRFLRDVPRALIVDEIVGLCGLERDQVAQLLETYLNEVPVGYATVAPHLSRDARILEVGSGLGLLSAFLAEQGYRIVSLEPIGTGFEFLTAGRQVVLRHLKGKPEQSLEIGAEELRADRHGRFNLIFSVHVLEHVEHLDEAFAAMAGVLEPTGLMVHLCPNYAFPYDPSFGVPLVPFRPALTKHLVPKGIGSSALWRSLNFITAQRVRRLARGHGMEAQFTTGQLANMIKRMQEDPIFAERHEGFAARALAAARAIGVERTTRMLPTWLDSPMLVELRFGH
jgi:2-polyprenyl-3-methyl-5-hydroxy-6-metoxy-1,4-benzoquinol methylase